MGDRKLPMNGNTGKPLKLVYNAEMRELLCCEKTYNSVCCIKYDATRSYIWLLDGAIEMNDANRAKCACAPGFCFPLQDSITKYYFDKKPFRPHGYCGNKCCYKEPKLEVVHGGCMCCCVHINPGPPCFAPKNSVVLMPFEKGSFPCCCVANRNNFNENCCGLCGPPTGDPKIFEMLPLQPKDAETFVKEAKKQLVGRNAPGMQEMDRAKVAPAGDEEGHEA